MAAAPLPLKNSSNSGTPPSSRPLACDGVQGVGVGVVEGIRTFWKGYLRLALVAIPVRLVTAERAEATPKFHQIDRKSKQRIHYIKVANGDKKVGKDDIVMGYEVEPGNYVLLEKGELDAVRLETRHTIELTQFVDASEIDAAVFRAALLPAARRRRRRRRLPRHPRRAARGAQGRHRPTDFARPRKPRRALRRRRGSRARHVALRQRDPRRRRHLRLAWPSRSRGRTCWRWPSS